MPLTDDPTVLLPFLEALDPGIMPDAGRTASAALALAESLLAQEDTPGSVLFVTDGVDPADIAAFPAGGSARAALVVTASPGTEVADWSRRADVATVPVSLDDGDVRAVERTLASSLARAAAAEGRLADDGWLLAIPAGLLVLLWFRRGTTLRWGVLLARPRAPPPPAEARAQPVLDPRPAGPPPLRGAQVPRGRRGLLRPGMARRGPLPRRQVRRGGRDPRGGPDFRGAIQPRHGAGPRPRLSGRRGGLRGGACARPRQRGGAEEPRPHEADHRLSDRGAAAVRRRAGPTPPTPR